MNQSGASSHGSEGEVGGESEYEMPTQGPLPPQPSKPPPHTELLDDIPTDRDRPTYPLEIATQPEPPAPDDLAEEEPTSRNRPAIPIPNAKAEKQPADREYDTRRPKSTQRYTHTHVPVGHVLASRYEVEGILGEGAFGVVYRCRDRVTGLKVAVKTLPSDVSHNTGEMEEILENFRLICGLSHPNIAKANTLEQDPDTGDYYFVMELVDGMNLRQWWRHKGLARSHHASPEEQTAETLEKRVSAAIPILRQIAAALDYAHSEGVVHRDVKPTNIMIVNDSTVKMLDFGIADQIRHSLTRTRSESESRTSGTGPYMPPEQWEGKRQDGSTDQYALCVTTYELLVGRPPFRSPSDSALYEMVRKRPPPKISALPPHQWKTLARGLSKRSTLRFATCSDMVDALDGRVAPLHRSFPIKRTIAGVVLVALLLAASPLLLNSRSANRERQCGELKIQALQKWQELQAEAIAPSLGFEERLRAASNRLALAEQAHQAGRFKQAAEGFEATLELTQGIRRDNEVRNQAQEAFARALARSRAALDEAAGLPEDDPSRQVSVSTGLEALRAYTEAGWGLAWLDKAQREQLAELQKSLSALEVRPKHIAGTVEVIDLGNGLFVEMVWVQPGSFQMGSPPSEWGRDKDEGPVHTAKIEEGFWLSRHEVTQAQWKQVMGENPSNFRDSPDAPVENVSWKDCMKFTTRLNKLYWVSDGTRTAEPGFRLPTEAEWEYACRAGSTGAFAVGDSPDVARTVAWYVSNSAGKTHEVGLKRPNAWGFYDMHGNVWEWCADSQVAYADKAKGNTGSKAGKYRAVRGGSWNVEARHCRSACRSSCDMSGRFDVIGMRLARAPLGTTVMRAASGK